MKISYAQRPAAGFSLLELLLVVAVGAVLILAGLGAYRLVSENNAANQGLRQLQTLKQQVQQAYQGQATYGTANASLVTELNTMRQLPPDMPVTGTTMRSAFNGTTTVVVGATNTQFVVTFNNVPTNACTKMGNSFSTATTSDFVSLSINGAAAITVPTTALITGATGCNNAGGMNTMAWTFR